MDAPPPPPPTPRRRASRPRRSPSARQAIEREVGKVIVGQRELVRQTLIGLLANSHVAARGRARASARRCSCARSPTSSTARSTASSSRPTSCRPTSSARTSSSRRAARGSSGSSRARSSPTSSSPTRSTARRPKTQSALLEAMQEHQVTVARNRYPLDPPFFVLATQNPLEMEGTYPLPEAQLDRFLFKVMVPFPSEEDLIAILDRTTGADAPTAARSRDRRRDRRDAAARPRACRSRRTSPRTPCAVLAATHPDNRRAPGLVAPVRALRRLAARRPGARDGGQDPARCIDGRFNVSLDDIRARRAAGAAPPRHPQLRGRGRGHHDRGHRPLDPRRGRAARRRVGRPPHDPARPA